MTRWVPGLHTARHYQREWLHHDIAAGLALAAVLVPVGVAYSVASGLPAICGLYATVTGLLAYALFGPSRILVLGPDSALVALIVGVVLPLSAGDPQRAMALAGMMALVAGATSVLAGVARLGFVTELLSKPIRYGYMNGIALTVLVTQVPTLLGIQVKADGIIDSVFRTVQAVLGGQVHLASFALGGGTLAAIWLLKRLPRIPAVLVAVAGATIVTALLDLDAAAGVQVLGVLPPGLPAFDFPGLSASDVGDVVLAGMAAALVALADTSVLSRSYAGRSGTRVDPNQEAVGLGAANLAAGLFQGFPISASSSRTPVLEAAGGKTQLAGVVGALAVAALLLWGPALLEHLPKSALAAVVIASAVSLFEFKDLRRIWRIQRWECWLSVGCTVGVAALGAIEGIGLAIVAAIIEFLWDAWRPHSAVLGKAPGVRGWHDIKRYPDAKQLPGLVLFRWDAPLFFADAELFHDKVLDAVAAAQQPVRRVVVGAEPITSVDVTAADIVQELSDRLERDGIELCFAELKDPVKDKLKRFGLFTELGAHTFFATISESVDVYAEEFGVRWEDGG